MSAGRHRCRGCRQTFRRRQNADDHWLRRCSPEARAVRLARQEEGRKRLAEVKRNLERAAEAARTSDRLSYGRVVGDWATGAGPDFAVTVEELNSTLNRLFFSLMAPAEPAGPALAPPDLLDARPGPDGTYTTE